MALIKTQADISPCSRVDPAKLKSEVKGAGDCNRAEEVLEEERLSVGLVDDVDKNHPPHPKEV